MDRKINPETGLPELPEGYFWRVQSGEASRLTTAKYLCVDMVRRPKRRYGNWFQRVADFWTDNGYYTETIRTSKSISVGRIQEYAKEKRISEDAAVKKYINHLAVISVEEVENQLQIIEVEGILDKYEGTYPPKNLNNL